MIGCSLRLWSSLRTALLSQQRGKLEHAAGVLEAAGYLRAAFDRKQGKTMCMKGQLVLMTAHSTRGALPATLTAGGCLHHMQAAAMPRLGMCLGTHSILMRCRLQLCEAVGS